jgi:hypothetical protein
MISISKIDKHSRFVSIGFSFISNRDTTLMYNEIMILQSQCSNLTDGSKLETREKIKQERKILGFDLEKLIDSISRR